MAGGSPRHYGGTLAKKRAAKRLRRDGLSYRAIGDRLGVTWQTARKWVFNKSVTVTHEPIDWAIVPLGEMPDAEIARALGVTQAAVWKQRTARGIPAAWNPRRDGAETLARARAALAEIRQRKLG